MGGSVRTADVELEAGGGETSSANLGGRFGRKFRSLLCRSKYCSTSGDGWTEKPPKSLVSLISIETSGRAPNRARLNCGTRPRVVDGVNNGEIADCGFPYPPRAPSTGSTSPSK